MKRLISVFLTALMLLQTIVLPVEAQTTGTCSGSINCNSFANQTSCAGYGCTWASTGTCSGNVTGVNCTGYGTDRTGCEVIGCTWTAVTGTCSGTATSCSSLSGTSCSAAGCTWTTVSANKVTAEITKAYDGGGTICMDLNFNIEGSPTYNQLELRIDGTYYDLSQGNLNSLIASGASYGICQFGPSCNDDKEHEIKLKMTQSDGTTGEVSKKVLCEAGTKATPVQISTTVSYNIDVVGCTTETVTFDIENTGKEINYNSICGDVFYNENNMGGIECKSLTLQTGEKQTIKAKVWANLLVGKTFTYKFKIGSVEKSDTCAIAIEKQALRATSTEGSQIADKLNKAVEYAEKLDLGTITLAEFLMYVNNELFEETRNLWNGLTDLNKATVGQELITIPSGENRRELKLYSGSKAKITLSVEKRAAWDLSGELVYKWELNFWLDTPSIDWQDRQKADEEARLLWEKRKQDKLQDIASKEAAALRASLPSNLLEKADVIKELILEVIEAIKKYETNKLVAPLAETRAKARIESEKILRDLFEDSSVEPAKLLDLVHLVILEIPGKVDVWENKGKLEINYWKSVYPEDKAVEWETAEIRLNVDAPSRMDYKELKWNAPYLGINIEKIEEGKITDISGFYDAMWQAEEKYRRTMEVGIAEAKAKKIISELKANISAETLKGLTDLKSKVSDYREMLIKYAKGEATIYELELARLKTEDDINRYISENVDWSEALDVAMILMVESSGEPLQMWGDKELPDCRKVYSNVQYELSEEELEEWPIESDLCVMRMNKREILKMRLIKQRLKELKEECISSGYVEIPHFVNVNVNWIIPWEFISKSVNRAGETFYKEKSSRKAKEYLSELLVPQAEEGISKEALALKQEVLNKLNELKELTVGYNNGQVSAFDLQYNVIKTREETGDMLGELDDEDQMNLFILVVNDLSAEGYPYVNKPSCGEEFDGVGITIASGEKAELNIGGNKFYEPLFNQYLGETRTVARLNIQMDVFWRECTPTLEKELKQAWEQIEAERAETEIEKIKEKRATFEAGFENEINDLIAQKENGDLTSEELNRQVFGIYRELQDIDYETARIMMRAGEDSFPEEYNQIDLHITTKSGIEIRIQEKPYSYGVETGEFKSEFAKESKEYAEKVIEEQEILQSLQTRETEMVTAVSESTSAGGQTSIGISEVTGKAVGVAESSINEVMIQKVEKQLEQIGGQNVAVGTSAGPMEKDIETMKRFIGGGVAGQAVPEEITSVSEGVIEGTSIKIERDIRIMPVQMIPKGGEQEIKTVKGFIPVHPPTINIPYTKEDIRKSGDELRGRWTTMKETTEDIKSQMLYSLNQEFTNNPLITEILSAWGNTITSFKLTRADGSLMEASFRTENGQLTDVKFAIDSQAGKSNSNILIEVDYEAVTDLMNWWRGKLKDADSPLELIINVPAFGFRVFWMVLTGKIRVAPFTAIFKVGDFFKVFDGAAKYATTGTLI